MTDHLKRDLLALLAKKVEDITMQVFDAATETELVGIGAMRQRVETAVTRWGSARQAGLVPGPNGPGARASAGRIETGQMYDGITGETNRVSETRIITQWGWQDPEGYEKFQEHGTDKIEGMEALHISLHEADDDLTARLRRIK